MSHTATCDLYEHVHEGVEPPEHSRMGLKVVR
jgi:hypothetical protein